METTADPGDRVDGERQVVTAETSDFQLRYVLRADVQTRQAVPVDLADGLEWQVAVGGGARVSKGDVLAVGRVPTEERQTIERALEDAQIELEVARHPLPDGSYDQARYAAARIGLDRAREDLERADARERSVAAPVDGTVERGPDTIAVVPVGLVVVAQLTPIQALRMLGVDFTAVSMVETPSGRSNQGCVNFVTGASLAGAPGGVVSAESEVSAEGDTAGGDVIESSAYSAVCELASGVPTVAGLPAKLRVEGPELRDAVVVPESAIRYRDDTGAAYVELDGRGPREVEVVLGPSNGLRRVVTSGIDPGMSIVVDPVTEIGESDLGGG